MAEGASESLAARRLVKAWFALDVVLALAPPLYWAMDRATDPVFGVPAALAYFLGVSASIAASVLFAWRVGRGQERAA